MTTTDTITPQALLNRAAALLDERGWYQGSWTGNDGCLCAWGALNVAAAEASGEAPSDEDPKPPDDEFTDASLYAAYQRAVRKFESVIRTYDIACWNDSPERTKDEVQAMLRRAAGGGA